MKVTRREFLRRTGSNLLALGVGSINFARYARVLAAPGPRKFALLVGIDRYGSESLDLDGCSTDVELQRLLLQYRFGFPESAILTLTGEKATREAIETAFEEHLIARVGPEDVVVFHFSGRGGRVGSPPDRDCLIPSDGPENALLLETLQLLARCLPTGRSTLVLDTGFAGSGGTRLGTLRSRAYPGGGPAELAFPEDLEKRYQPKNPVAPLCLTAAGRDGIAAEIGGNGWSAGLFTYSLTRYLWEMIPSPVTSIALKRVNETIASLMEADAGAPVPPSGNRLLPYHILPEKSMGGEAIVTRLIDDKTSEITLTGLPIEVLENYGSDSRLACRGADGEEIAVAILSRQGLTARAKSLSPTRSPAVGQVLQEKRRVFPGKVGLVVALDRNLSRIERVDATSAFASLPIVSAVVNVGERRVDCLLSRVGTDESASYHLLSPNGALILGSLGAGNEAVKSGVKRLEPLLKTLLAHKLWRILVNAETSGVGVGVRLESVGKLPLARQDTRRALVERCPGVGDCPSVTPGESENPVHLAIGTEIRYRVENRENTPLHCLIVGIDNARRPLLVCERGKAAEAPVPPTREFIPFVIAPASHSLVPGSPLTVPKPTGLVEHYLFFSRTPPEKTFAVLNSRPTIAGETEPFLTLARPLEMTRALWEDTRVPPEISAESLSGAPDNPAFDVGTWAAFRFIFRVTSPTTS